MRVRAKETGFYAGARRRAGSVFDFKGAKPAKWMEPLEAVEAPVEPKQAKAPRAPKPAEAPKEPAPAAGGTNELI